MNKNKPKHTIENPEVSLLNDNSELISGIYNYCDRWCERCKFTDRCNVYLLEKKEGVDINTFNMEDALNRVSDIFAITMDKLQQMADEYGIDLDDISDIDTIKYSPGELEQLATDYFKDVHQWISDNYDFLNKQIEQFFSFNEEISKMINEVVEVISWYAPLIGAKIHRAMFVQDFETEIDDYDKLGSAKIALISIDRSIGAFSFLLNNIPKMEDSSLKFLSILTKIKRMLLDVYPNAMDFHRPGFDD